MSMDLVKELVGFLKSLRDLCIEVESWEVLYCKKYDTQANLSTSINILIY